MGIVIERLFHALGHGFSQADKSSIESLTNTNLAELSEETSATKCHDIELSSTKEWNVPECRLSAERQANMLIAGIVREVELAKSLMGIHPRKGPVDNLSTNPGPEPQRHWCLAKVTPRQLRAARTYLEIYVDRHGGLPEGEISFDASTTGDLILRVAEIERYVFRADEF